MLGSTGKFMSMGISERDVEKFHAKRAAERLAETLELDREDTHILVNKIKEHSRDFIDQVQDALDALTDDAAEGVRCYFQSELAVFLPQDDHQFTPEEIMAPLEMAPVIGKFLSGTEIYDSYKYFGSALRRSARIGKDDTQRFTLGRGALVQSCIAGGTFSLERDDTQWSDMDLVECLTWFDENADALVPLTAALRDRAEDGLLDYGFCRDLVGTARHGASVVLMNGAL